ncbi:hypothetical protein TNCV_3675991 [Trichonephila clavipes]|nr:hypothetical protein TNCV_3675991 [Trichonephila clavipes]
MHFGSRVQSVEECPADAHLEQDSCPRSVSSGTPNRGTTSRLTGAGSFLPPVYSEALAKENAEVSLGHQSHPYGRRVGKGNAKDPQNTIFILTGRRTRQKCGLANQWYLWSRREKKKRKNGMTRKMVGIREGSLAYLGLLKPVFTKVSKPRGKRKDH